jgi:hypothetical protein
VGIGTANNNYGSATLFEGIVVGNGFFTSASSEDDKLGFFSLFRVKFEKILVMYLDHLR